MLKFKNLNDLTIDLEGNAVSKNLLLKIILNFSSLT